MKLAALDLGSNSFHLLVAQVSPSGQISKLGSRKEMLRLGTVVQAHGELGAQAFSAALATVGRMVESARELGAEKVLCVATSAIRDARDGAAFCQACTEKWGVKVELVSGDDEAQLAYLGARSSFSSWLGRSVVADLGGGSVEIAVGESANSESVFSLPLGFLRIAQRFPLDEPGAALRLAGYVRDECTKVRWAIGSAERLVLSGGTARAIGKVLPSAGEPVSSARLIAYCSKLSELSPSKLRDLGVEEARSTNLAIGAAVIAGIIGGIGQNEVRIASGGLREGLLLRELASQRKSRAA